MNKLLISKGDVYWVDLSKFLKNPLTSIFVCVTI